MTASSIRMGTSVALCLSGVIPCEAQQQPASGTLQIQVAVVVADVTVRPVPLHDLLLTGPSPALDTFAVRSALDGSASIILRAGTYRLRSLRSVRVENRSYSWDLQVDVHAGRSNRVELTNANAVVDSLTAAAPSRQVAPEMALYERVRLGIVKVQAGAAHGSGFLVTDLAGAIVTNDHVIDAAYGGEVSVYLDQASRRPAQVLAVDHQADLAVIRVNPAMVAGLPQLPLVTPDSAGALAMPGERVLAVGYPLTQRSTVTTGIVSGVREGAVISDVTIDHGNSGGPMLNMAGQVIAVNTFGASSGPGGLAGAVSVSRLTPLLRQAAEVAARTAPPPARELPVVPLATYPLDRIRSIADTARDRVYRALETTELGNFTVTFLTPVSQFVAYRQYQDEVSRDRRAREARAGLPEQERFRTFGPMRDWMQYVGNETSPAVTVVVSPKAGETAGSIWGRAFGVALLGPMYQQRARMAFKGDVQSMRLYRNGELVTPVVGGRTEQVAFVDNAWVSMSDVAYRGVYVFRPEVFAPDSVGVPPSIVMVIRDLKNLDRENVWELYASTVARIWNDFLPYVASGGLTGNYPRASAQTFRSILENFCATRNCWHGSQDEPLLAGLRAIATDDTSGVLVTYLSRQSPLYAAGLREGRQIVSANGQRTLTWAAFEQAVAGGPLDSLVLNTVGYGGRGPATPVRLLRPR